MPRLIWTPPALLNVQRLYRFLAGRNPDAAKRAAKAIRDGVRVLARQPGVGRPVQDMPTQYREWMIDFGDMKTIISAACAYRAGGHIAVAMITERLPASWRSLLSWVVDILMAAVSGFVAWYGTQLCIATWGQSIAELAWLPVGATYASLPLGGALTLLFVIERRFFGDQSRRPLMRYEEQLDEVHPITSS